MLRVIAIVSFLIPVLCFAAAPSDDGKRVIYRASGAFDDFRDDISDAILERGMVISSVSHVGEMLERTGKDLGDSRPIYYKAEVLEFCNAVISRRALAADPHSIVYCPYRIAIYSLPEAPETIYLAFPRLKASSRSGSESEAALKAVEDMLRGIIEEVLE